MINKYRSILELSNEEAKAFFLKKESYSSIELPPYFIFDDLLKNVSKIIGNKKSSDLRRANPRNYEKLNYTLFSNKDGKYAWRPLQLIHPAIYVSLVNEITQVSHWNTIKERFEKFRENKKIRCLSLPVESLTVEKDKAAQISQWWVKIEQQSIELSLDFEYIMNTDITDCYGSIYTHSIPWALHTKEIAKLGKNRNNTELIGVVIDNHIQDMSYGQTNGIPQGSTLMDFIAEMVLGYADFELSKKISKITDYCILRYRDDYRIFVNNPQEGEKILKLLTEVMIDLGMKLNQFKTVVSNDVIRSSIKADKLHWMEKVRILGNHQKYLLMIHNHSQQFPNSGSLIKPLSDFYLDLIKKKKVFDVMPMISIAVDIAFYNPRTYPIVFAILSKLISFLDNDNERGKICKKIINKFDKIPNTNLVKVWLQRISMNYQDFELNEPLCRLASNLETKIWNNEWISISKLKKILDGNGIIDHELKNNINPIIPIKEVELFVNRASTYY